MNDKQIILKKLLVFFACIFILDLSIGYILKKFYFLQETSYDYRTTYMIDTVRSDVLVLGSSRASHHYNVSLIEDSLKLTAYNGGRDGCAIFYYYGVLECALKRYHPKVIVLDMRLAEFENDQDDYDRLSMLLPYYDSHPEIRSICLLRSKFERFKLLSKIYPYNSKLFTLMATAFHLRHQFDESKLKGYLPVDGVYGGPEPSEKYSNKIDTTKVKYFNSFLDNCQKAKVKVVVCISPIYIHATNNSRSIEIAKKLCAEKHIPFFDYSDNPDFANSKFFIDDDHLNTVGADIFTKMFINHIRTAIDPNEFNLRYRNLANR